MNKWILGFMLTFAAIGQVAAESSRLQQILDSGVFTGWHNRGLEPDDDERSGHQFLSWF